jgi:hypothetical protein
LRRLKASPIFVYDTKGEPKFEALGAHRVITGIDEYEDAADDQTIDYVIVRPPAHLLRSPRELDEYLWAHYQTLHGVPAFIDEADQWVDGPRGGAGLTSLLSRGRSRGISSILATQRPAFIPRKMVTEATHTYAFRLTDRADRKRLSDVIPGFDQVIPAAKHHFHYHRSGEDKAKLFAPIALDKSLDTGAIDKPASVEVQAGETARRLWL